MFRGILSCAAFVATLIGTRPLDAQSASPLVGRWALEWELGRVSPNDPRAITANGTLTVVASGDSLIATFEVQRRSDGRALPAPFTAGGRGTATGTTFVQTQEARLNMNGEELVRQVRVTWNLRAVGDTLTGEMQREIEGLMTGAALGTPVTGSRMES